MNAAVGLHTRVQEFLREQHHLGYRLVSCGRELLNFASFAEDSKHLGAVTVELTSQWARGRMEAMSALKRRPDGW